MYTQADIYRFYDQGVDSVVRLVFRLTDKIEDLEVKLYSKPESAVPLLKKELQKAQRTLARRSDELLREQQLNYQLRHRLLELERALESGTPHVERDSHNSSLPPSTDPPWKKVPRTRSLRKKSGLKVGGQPGHAGATLRQVEQPNHLIIHTPDLCSSCGSSLARLRPRASVRRQVFDIGDGSVRVTEHRAEAKTCTRCLKTTRAEFPASVRAPVQYGRGVLARSSYLHLYQLLPVGRTAETMRDLFGCALSPATVQRFARLSSAKLLHAELRIKGALRDASVIGVDETGLRVAGQVGYVHVARTDALTHYAYDERRGKAAMDEIGILPQFRGTLVRDGYSSYAWYGQCRHSLCNVHLLRDLIFIEETAPEQKVWTEPLARLLLQIKEAAAQARGGSDAGLGDEEERNFLRRYERLVRRAARLNPPPERRARRGPPRSRPALPTPASIIKRLEQKRDEVLRFMLDTRVPFDNNGSERDLRMVKLQQKVSGCFRTEDGARGFCRVRSYLSTARKQGHPLLHALERVLAGKPLVFSPAAGAG